MGLQGLVFAAALAGTLASGVAHAGELSPATRVDDYVTGLSRQNRFSGVVLVARDGKPVFLKAYGPAVLGWNIANDLDTRFEIASLTKQFTGATILALAEDGKLSVGDPVSKYYPHTPKSWDGITIEMLVTHTSGLPNNKLSDFTKGIATSYTPEELLATFRDRPLAYKPGTSWAYTNTEYYLLAYIIEKVSGESYGDYVRDRIFKRAGMTHTSFGSTLAVVPHAAEGYARDGGEFRHRDYFDRSLEIGAGGISTTVGDLLRWNNALDGGTLLNARSRARMFATTARGNYGYGWFVDKKPRLREYHEGSDPGFAAFEARYPRDRLLVVVLSNYEDAPVRDMEARISAEYLPSAGGGMAAPAH